MYQGGESLSQPTLALRPLTVFIISHNLQIEDPAVPEVSADQLAQLLTESCTSIQSVEVLDHSHWMLRIESDKQAELLAQNLVDGWRAMREASGHASNHKVIALGGRKDSDSLGNSPLQKGFWGVDVVETRNAEAFLQAINWEGLKSSRPPDAVFEIFSGV